MFESDGESFATLGPAEHRFHASHQPHAMTTTDSAIKLGVMAWPGSVWDVAINNTHRLAGRNQSLLP